MCATIPQTLDGVTMHAKGEPAAYVGYDESGDSSYPTYYLTGSHDGVIMTTSHSNDGCYHTADLDGVTMHLKVEPTADVEYKEPGPVPVTQMVNVGTESHPSLVPVHLKGEVEDTVGHINLKIHIRTHTREKPFNVVHVIGALLGLSFVNTLRHCVIKNKSILS